MAERHSTSRPRWRLPTGLAGALFALAFAPTAWASACRVTDFTDRTLTSLNHVERLAFAMQMTRVEYERLRSVPPEDPDHIALITQSASLSDARQSARRAFDALKIENGDGYARFWAHDFLTDEQMRKFADCESARQPGLALYGRSESPGEFHLTYVHITPIGIEQITTKVIASANIGNLEDFEASLAELGPQDNYTARTFALRLKDPSKPAVLVMRAGWETPKFAYIPVYPTKEYAK